MAPLSWLIGHGGLYGLIAEAVLALAVAALFVWIWLRERRRSRLDGQAEMRDLSSDEPE